MKENTDKMMALADIKKKMGATYTQMLIKQSELFNRLHVVGEKAEDQISKKDLYALINACCNYMKAHNIHEYYVRCYRELKFDGIINNENCKD